MREVARPRAPAEDAGLPAEQKQMGASPGKRGGRPAPLAKATAIGRGAPPRQLLFQGGKEAAFDFYLMDVTSFILFFFKKGGRGELWWVSYVYAAY